MKCFSTIQARALSLLALVAMPGCNAVLGIDVATQLPDASTDGPTSDGAKTCSLEATDECNGCVAANCCTEYETCVGNADCKKDLVDYAFCLGNRFTDNVSADDCSEAFATQSPINLALAKCATMDKCGSACEKKTFGDLCITYCGCMAGTCEDQPFDGGSCAEACAHFSTSQLVCRPYHCSLADKNRTNEVERQRHCGHAAGLMLCP